MKLREISKITIPSYILGTGGTFLLSYLKLNSNIPDSLINSFQATTLITFWWAFYLKVGWKIPGLNFFMNKKNLNGTYFGEYNSYDSLTGNKFSGEISFKINQDYLKINIITMTEKFSNYSYSEELQYNEDSKEYGIIYVYTQKDQDPMNPGHRNGAATLKVLKINRKIHLKGEFWTIHGTIGTLNVQRISRKKLDGFEEARRMYYK